MKHLQFYLLSVIYIVSPHNFEQFSNRKLGVSLLYGLRYTHLRLKEAPMKTFMHEIFIAPCISAIQQLLNSSYNEVRGSLKPRSQLLRRSL